MKSRCSNPKSTDWHLYGGRGISICEQWMDFGNFLADMGECPDGLSIERKDTNGNYEPSNCKWATNDEQASNRRDNVNVTFRGKTQTVTKWGRERGFGKGTLLARIRKGWEINEETMTPPNAIPKI